jgi:hypothetical protein
MHITIKTDNDAFADDEGREVSRILRDIAQDIEDGRTHGPCMDANGNKVGSWSF